MKKYLMSMVALLLVVGVIAGCSAKGGSNASSQAKEIVITAKNMTFEPNTITVDKGTKIKLTFKNEEDATNNLMIEGTNIKIENVGAKQQKSNEFVADRQGEFKITTSDTGMGSMTGKLIVK
ncbi:cupredoxin domain-containing protein [Paenibacillus chondroitinus]|uniref:Cupredoxin domain-containing protein n=1 Tax=Paenibacillus chondroitinus TaxID=59842 RepID=A0ABU6DGJ8_9BACL|nr:MULTISPECIES: cupredoxin domain-containing protein [Paenibacillus]MCY9659495.1 cupredoxin domain-containing protein [Paenibacillus anseongense]MEB4796890.1 cupredoxin domain-containing protein [Paenibacillus chondroitinus]